MPVVKKSIPKAPVTVDELLEKIPDRLPSDIFLQVEANTNKWVPVLKANLFFKLLIYSCLTSPRLSLRIISENFKSPFFKMFSPSSKAQAVHSSIHARLENVAVDYFKLMYEHFFDQVKEHYDEKKLKRNSLIRYDSTMIAVFSRLFQGMRVGKKSKKKSPKSQIKLTFGFENDYLLNFKIYTTQTFLSEDIALRDAIMADVHPEGQIMTFDRGVQKRETFAKFAKVKREFVVRVRENIRFEPVREHTDEKGEWASWCGEDTELVGDQIVKVFNGKNKLIDTEFRLVTINRLSDGKRFYFLTDIMNLSPCDIAQIYRYRWDIEVLFRFLKQELDLGHFVNHDMNAIQVLLYCKLIAAMLILIYKKKNEIKSYIIAKIRFVNELFSTIILDVVQTQEGVEDLKSILKNNILRI